MSRAAAEFARRLDWIEGLQGKDKEAAMKPFLADIGQREMAVVRKNQLRERFTATNNAYMAEVKARQAAEGKAVSVRVEVGGHADQSRYQCRRSLRS